MKNARCSIVGVATVAVAGEVAVTEDAAGLEEGLAIGIGLLSKRNRNITQSFGPAVLWPSRDNCSVLQSQCFGFASL